LVTVNHAAEEVAVQAQLVGFVTETLPLAFFELIATVPGLTVTAQVGAPACVTVNV
jgi:hypothetical protein